jgi:2-polyprenyl-3-methyl-5-hydroxy-6-metoxy-1,4-benzoquinol methylase
MKFNRLIEEYCLFFKTNYNQTKEKILSDYYRSFKDYDKIKEDSFTFNMLKKYENIYDHYSDIEYVEACLLFYKINCSNVLRILKNIINDKYKDILTKKESDIVKNFKKIADIGAGIGALTLSLRDISKNSEIYYINLKSKQYDFANYLFTKNNANIIIKEKYDDVGEVDIILSLDYFEHFENFIIEVQNVLNKLKPKMIIDTSDFTYAFVGHFENYIVNGEKINHKKCFKIFEKILLSYGYKRCLITKSFWNNKPRIYFKG